MIRKNRATEIPSRNTLPRNTLRRVPAPLTAIPAVAKAQWRQARGLLLAIGVTVLLAVALAASIAPFSTVMLTAALRSALTQTPDSDRLVVATTPNAIGSHVNQSLTADTDNVMGGYLGKSLSSQREALAEAPDLALLTKLPPPPSEGVIPSGNSNLLTLLSATASTLHLQTNVIKGRLPADSASNIEIALTADAARALGVTVGGALTANLSYLGAPSKVGLPPPTLETTLRLPVVGIFAPATTDDPYLNATTFMPHILDHGYRFTALASQSALLSALDRIAAANTPSYVAGAEATLAIIPQAQIFQIYHLDVAHISIDQVDALFNATVRLQIHFDNAPVNQGVYGATLTGGPLGAGGSLAVFRGQAQFPQLVVGLFLAQIVALALLFISTLAEILVERQEGAVALLRSRGSPRWYLFAALGLEGATATAVGAAIGTLLAIPVALWIARAVLAPTATGALNAVTADTAGQLRAAMPYGLGIAGVAILTILLITGRVVRLNVLVARQEAGRSTRRFAWQRLNLDLVAALLALVSFGVSAYLAGTVLDSQQSRALLAPLAIATPILLAVAVALLALRLFPWALQGAAWLANRGRGATPQLALAQLARAPGQSLRAALLLAFALALVIVTGIFAASQTQRLPDTASYLSVADFSGALPFDESNPSFSNLTKQYQQIPGVTSVCLGYTHDGYQEAFNATIELQAVDTGTYAQTVNWTWAGAPQSLAPLLSKLIPKKLLIPPVGVPALLDAHLWNMLHASVGDQFLLDMAEDSTGASADRMAFPFVAVGELTHLPPLADSASSDASSDVVSGGLLVDYQTYADYYKRIEFDNRITPNHIWLRTMSNPATLVKTRAALTQGALRLNPLYDRRAIMAYLQRDAIYLDLTVVPLLGALLTLVLAIVGIALSAWQSTSQRVVGFGLLRALGVSRGQVARILWWEQLAIYPLALALGVAMGFGLGGQITRALVYTGIMGAPVAGATLGLSGASGVDEFYARQESPPVRVVYPPEIAMLVVGLVVLGLVAATLMAWRVSRRTSGTTLRFGED